MKIQIIGFSGSGKSSLAKTLSLHYNLPLLHLDNVQFYGDWSVRSKEEQNRIVRDFLEKNKSGWVIDGNYTNIVPERFAACDMIIYLNYNRFFCYKEAKKRYKNNKGKNRDSCPCVEKFDWWFRKWVLFTGRTKAIKKRNLENVNKCHGTKLVFKNRKILKNYLKEKGINYIYH